MIKSSQIWYLIRTKVQAFQASLPIPVFSWYNLFWIITFIIHICNNNPFKTTICNIELYLERIFLFKMSFWHFTQNHVDNWTTGCDLYHNNFGTAFVPPSFHICWHLKQNGYTLVDTFIRMGSRLKCSNIVSFEWVIRVQSGGIRVQNGWSVCRVEGSRDRCGVCF